MIKEDFIKTLESMSIEQVNTVIKERGKKPKLITPIIYLKGNKK